MTGFTGSISEISATSVKT